MVDRRKASIPAVPTGATGGRQPFDQALKQNLEVVLGRLGPSDDLVALPDTATTAEVIAAVNKIIARLS